MNVLRWNKYNCYTMIASFLFMLAIYQMNSLLFPAEIHGMTEKPHIKMESSPKLSVTQGKFTIATGNKLRVPIFNENCLFMRNGGERPIHIPPKSELDHYKLHDLGCLFDRYLTSLQTLCRRLIFTGNVRSGGVMYCADLEPQPSGNIYFYEKDIVEFRGFLLDLVRRFQTNVTYFYKTSPLNVSLDSKKGILNQIQDAKLVHVFERMNDIGINILPIFINRSESALRSLENSLRTDSLKFVHVLILKLHYEASNYTKEGLRHWLETLRTIYAKDFRLYWFNRSNFNNSLTVCFIKRYASTRINSEDFTLPARNAILNMFHKEAIIAYQTSLLIIQYHCKEFVRMGNALDGGWDVCIDKKYAPSNPMCLVYSFGINFDWSFDENVSKTFDCEVHSFDPSMDLPFHMHSPGIFFHRIGIFDNDTNIQGGIRRSPLGRRRKSTWKVRTLQSILKENGHLNHRIDILKLDVEGAEWAAFHNMISTGVLKNVKQLLVEFHGIGSTNRLLVIRQLYDEGFRVFWVHRNPVCGGHVENVPVCGCIETCFVNTHM